MFQICFWKWLRRSTLRTSVTSRRLQMKQLLLQTSIIMTYTSKSRHVNVVISKTFNVDTQFLSNNRFFKKNDIQLSFIACTAIRRFWSFNKRLIHINTINKSLLQLNLIIRSLSSRKRDIFSKKLTIVMNFIQKSLVHDYLIKFRLSYLIQPFLNICSSNNFYNFNLHLIHHTYIWILFIIAKKILLIQNVKKYKKIYLKL